MHQAFNYVQRNGGLDTEDSYPYRATTGFCRYNSRNLGAKITGAVSIPQGDEQKLMEALGSVGPVSVSIDASHPSFQHYASGVYQEHNCNAQNVDHAVLAVGYGTDCKGNDYYLIKNSWGKHFKHSSIVFHRKRTFKFTDFRLFITGKSWGEDGFLKIKREKNHCGIASAAIYPLV